MCNSRLSSEGPDTALNTVVLPDLFRYRAVVAIRAAPQVGIDKQDRRGVQQPGRQIVGVPKRLQNFHFARCVRNQMELPRQFVCATITEEREVFRLQILRETAPAGSPPQDEPPTSSCVHCLRQSSGAKW